MNAAGASPTVACAHAAVVAHLGLECQMGGYAAADHVAPDAHVAIAALLNCGADEIAIVESAQAAWARALYSLAFREGDRIVCFESEYAGNAVAMLQLEKRSGVKVHLGSAPNGRRPIGTLRLWAPTADRGCHFTNRDNA